MQELSKGVIMKDSKQLAKAIQIASTIHLAQVDRGNKPYILHPLHIMSQLLYDMQLATIAVLHDVIEDSDGRVTLYTLKEDGFSTRVLTALKLLTHTEEQDYLSDYIAGICTNIDAITVKRKDLEHNSDITRLKGVTDKDLARMKKYHIAFTALGLARKNFV